MQTCVHLVNLVNSFPTTTYLQNLASIQKRTSPVKFAHLAEKSRKGSISNLSTKVVDQEDDFGRTPLTEASFLGHSAVAKLLLKHNANVDYEGRDSKARDSKASTNYEGETALMAASSGGREAVVRLLLQHKAAVDTESKSQPALMRASSEGHLGCK